MDQAFKSRARRGPVRRALRRMGQGVFGAALVLALVWLSFALGAWLQAHNARLAYWAGIGAQTLFTLARDAGSAFGPPRQPESEALTLAVERDGPRGPLLAVTEGTQALLLDREGRIRHRWDAEHPAVFADSDMPDSNVNWREPVLMPDGDLVAVHHRNALLRPADLTGQSRRGLGVARLAPDGTARWTTRLPAHHAPALDRDGNVLVLWRAPVNTRDPRYPTLNVPFFDEGLARLDAETGEVLRRASFLDLLAGSGFGNILHNPPTGGNAFRLKGEIFHGNSIEAVSPRAARRAAFADAGDVVVSFRNLSNAAVLDAETWQVKTLLRGPWNVQHDVGVVPSGDVAAFDNRAPGGGSRVVVWDPASGAITATFGVGLMDSPFRGTRQRLPDGGVLATDAWGKAIAFAPDGTERWRLRLADDGVFLNHVRRVPPDKVAHLLDGPAGGKPESYQRPLK